MQTLLAKFPLVLTDNEMEAIGVSYGWLDEYLKPPPLALARAPPSRLIEGMLKATPPGPPPQLTQLTPLAPPPAEAGSRVPLPVPPPQRAAPTVASAQAAVRPKAKASGSVPVQNAVPVSPPPNAVPVSPPQNVVANASSSSGDAVPLSPPQNVVAHAPSSSGDAVPLSPPQNVVANAPSSSGDGGAGNENGVEERLCAICQQPVEDGTPLYVTPCAHVFHQECTQRWQACNRPTRALKCPICRHQTDLMGTAQGDGHQPVAPDASFDLEDDFPPPSPEPEETVAAPPGSGSTAAEPEPSFL